MKVITAVGKIGKVDLPTIFLAGGITSCAEWQDDIIELLEPYDNAILLNPRRRNFPIHDPNASKEQITWEFNALAQATIFSMWFSKGTSDQPICMYELGRHLALRYKLPETLVIGVEPGYKRENDVWIQTDLVSKQIADNISNNLEEHAQNILRAVKEL